MVTDTYSTAGSFTWTAPAGVSSVQANVIDDRSACGGGGGAYTIKTAATIGGVNNHRRGNQKAALVPWLPARKVRTSMSDKAADLALFLVNIRDDATKTLNALPLLVEPDLPDEPVVLLVKEYLARLRAQADAMESAAANL